MCWQRAASDRAEWWWYLAVQSEARGQRVRARWVAWVGGCGWDVRRQRVVGPARRASSTRAGRQAGERAALACALRAC